MSLPSRRASGDALVGAICTMITAPLLSMFVIPQAPLYAGMAGLPHAPLLQWVLLPLLTVWFTRRQLASAQDTAAL